MSHSLRKVLSKSAVSNYSKQLLFDHPRLGNVRFVPKADIDRLIRYLVGSGKERWRHGDTERLRGLQVDHQLKFVWVLDRHVGRLGAFQDAIDIGSRALEKLVRVDAVRHQPTARGEEAVGIDRGQPVAGGEGDDGVAMHDDEVFRQNKQSGALFARES